MLETNFPTMENHDAGEPETGNEETIISESTDSWENLLESINVKTEPDNLVELKNPFHMRQMTLSSISSSSGQLRQTLSSQAAGTKLTGKYMTSARKSLDLLRLNIQSLVNKEIDAVLQKYLEKFFQPAIENIRNNLGENSVTDESIRTVCRHILEDAKVQYSSGSQSRGSSPFSDSETGNLGDFRFSRPAANSPLPALPALPAVPALPTVPTVPTVPTTLPATSNKRKESDAESDAILLPPKPRKKTLKTPGSSATSGAPAPPKVVKFDNIRREGPKWDPSRIVKSTLFIMGARANKVLGFGQTRGRLYAKHPELLKYSGDTEDKEWLARHNLIPPTGGIAYLLLLEDVKELAESEEYRYNPNVLLHDLKGFQVPEFMLKKIRAYISQARTDCKEQMRLTYYNDTNDTTGQINYTVDCASVIMTPPATVLGSAPGTPCEALEFMDCPSSLLTSVHANDYLSSLSQNFLYDTIAYCEGSKDSETSVYSSTATLPSNILNVNNTSSLPSLLMTPLEGDNSFDLLE